MKTIERRSDQLEDRLAPRNREQLVVILQQTGRQLALDNDRCIQILRETGWVDPVCAIVWLTSYTSRVV